MVPVVYVKSRPRGSRNIARRGREFPHRSKWPAEMMAFCLTFPTTKGASMPRESLVACIFAGILLGWFSNGITKGRSVGLGVNVVVGIASAIFGARFLPEVGRTVGFGELAR